MESKSNGDTPTTSEPYERQQLRDRLLAELRASTLEPWQADLCRVVARQKDTRLWFIGDRISKRMVDAATALADRKVDRTEVKLLMRSQPWMDLWQKERPRYLTAEVEEAKAGFLGLMPKGLDVYHKSLDHIKDTLDADEEIKDKDGNTIAVRDKMGAVRAAAPLLSPIVAHALPRKAEVSDVRTQIIVHLSPGQTMGLDAPVMVVEAHEVKQIPAGDSDVSTQEEAAVALLR